MNQTAQTRPLEQALNVQGYPALLRSHCQLVDQVANLTAALIALWEDNQELRRLLDMPRQPLPLAASQACATQTAARPASEDQRAAITRADEELLIDR